MLAHPCSSEPLLTASLLKLEFILAENQQVVLARQVVVFMRGVYHGDRALVQVWMRVHLTRQTIYKNEMIRERKGHLLLRESLMILPTDVLSLEMLAIAEFLN